MIDWERFEGMLIRIPQTLTVTDTFTLGRFGEVGLSVGGRLRTPTHAATPGAAASALQDLNNRSRILLDDGDSRQNIDPIVHPVPGLSATNTLRLGATVDNLTGVLEQRFSGYRIQPVGPIAFTAANPRPAAPSVGGTLKVASFNVLNYFNGNGMGGGFPTPRGATTTQEFTRQRDKIINAITTLNADIVGLIEIENDSGANSAIADLVNGLNAVSGAGTYTFIDTGVVGTDEIRLALIFKPAMVAPVGPFKILNTAVNPQFLDTKNRPALAQTFRQLSNGARFTIALNHFKSKGRLATTLQIPTRVMARVIAI
jgi:predicted extracellular nuclease